MMKLEEMQKVPQDAADPEAMRLNYTTQVKGNPATAAKTKVAGTAAVTAARSAVRGWSREEEEKKKKRRREEEEEEEEEEDTKRMMENNV